MIEANIVPANGLLKQWGSPFKTVFCFVNLHPEIPLWLWPHITRQTHNSANMHSDLLIAHSNHSIALHLSLGDICGSVSTNGYDLSHTITWTWFNQTQLTQEGSQYKSQSIYIFSDQVLAGKVIWLKIWISFKNKINILYILHQLLLLQSYYCLPQWSSCFSDVIFVNFKLFYFLCFCLAL